MEAAGIDWQGQVMRQLSVEPWGPGTNAGSLVDGIGGPGDPGAGTHPLWVRSGPRYCAGPLEGRTVSWGLTARPGVPRAGVGRLVGAAVS